MEVAFEVVFQRLVDHEGDGSRRCCPKVEDLVDYVGVAMQHGVADYQIAAAMLQAINLTGNGTPICRVPWNEPGIIGRMLDAGARGVIIPMVNSVEEAKRAVAATKYPPAGERSYGPTIIGARARNAG